jgi:chemotaxis protein methyltransferase CheR
VVKRAAGIHLGAGRERVVQLRVASRLRATRSADFTSYIRRLEQDTSGRELSALVDALTVHKTAFFREPTHFPVYLDWLAELAGRKQSITVWSAGCASGEEVYTLAMLGHMAFADLGMTVRLLGTDISPTMLTVARSATYRADRLCEIPPEFHSLVKQVGDRPRTMQVVDDVRRCTAFAHLNLIGDWPMRGPMHAVFCRNVMIYFDRSTQNRLTDRFWDILEPGGYLFVGHSEALPQDCKFTYVQPAVYRKLPESP